MERDAGFTVIELLIVIAVIGILAAVLTPNVIRARESARYRAAEVYAKDVYTVSLAYLAEDVDNVVQESDCTSGYRLGLYEVRDPGSSTVVGCKVTDPEGTGIPVIVVETLRGRIISVP